MASPPSPPSQGQRRPSTATDASDSPALSTSPADQTATSAHRSSDTTSSSSSTLSLASTLHSDPIPTPRPQSAYPSTRPTAGILQPPASYGSSVGERGRSRSITSDSLPSAGTSYASTTGTSGGGPGRPFSMPGGGGGRRAAQGQAQEDDLESLNLGSLDSRRTGISGGKGKGIFPSTGARSSSSTGMGMGARARSTSKGQGLGYNRASLRVPNVEDEEDEEDEEGSQTHLQQGRERAASPFPGVGAAGRKVSQPPLVGPDIDDEVERRDRGEELVRKRMKDRARLKKETEKAARKAAEATTARRASTSFRPLSPSNPSYSESTASPLGENFFNLPLSTPGAEVTGLDFNAPPRMPRSRETSSSRRTTPSVTGTVNEREEEVGEGVETEGYVTGGGTEGEFEEDEFREAEEERKGAEELEQILDEEEEEDDQNNGGEIEYTLRDRQDAINIEHPFGLPIWKPALYKKDRSVTLLAENSLHALPSSPLSHLSIPNVLWALLFGSWLAIACTVVSAVLWCTPFGGAKYGRVLLELGAYLAWPFGRYVEGWTEDDDDDDDEETSEDEEEADERRLERDLEQQGSLYGAGREGRGRGAAASLGEREGLLGSRMRERDYGAVGRSSSEDTVGAGRRASERRHSGATSTAHLHDFNKDENGHRLFRIRSLGRLMYWFGFYVVVAPLMLLACTICWGLVFTIPMAKLLWVLLRHLSNEPLSLHFRSPPKYTLADPNLFTNGNTTESLPPSSDNQPSPAGSSTSTIDARTVANTNANAFNPLPPPVAVSYPLVAGQRAPRVSRKSVADAKAHGRLFGPHSTVLLCTYKAAGLQYYKYTVDGVNILFINLLSVVIFVIFDFFFIAPQVEEHAIGGFLRFVAAQSTIFVLALLSVVPLSYFIGMAVASISAQSSIGMGAFINASFGSLIEIILYCIALQQGKAELVEGSIVGSILAAVLLMPGLSMVAGATKRKEQRFNAKSAGVTSTMLIMAIIGVLTPTFFYEIYGSFQLTCTGCDPSLPGGTTSACKACYYEHVDPVDDPFYQGSVKLLSYYCAIILVVSYLIGLWFSLRTHASQIWQNAQPSHEHPNPAGGGRPLTTVGLPVPASTAERTSIYKRVIPSNFLSALTPSATPRVLSMSLSNAPLPNLELPSGMTPEDFKAAMEAAAKAAGPGRVVNVPQSPARNLPPLTRQTSHVETVVKVETDAEHGGHDAPNWSRSKSASVLMGCTILYAVIAEILVDVVDVVLKGSGIPEKFLGVTLFALVPNTTEFMNAISFAINGNIALSMEIGSAYALQVCLIQAPAMLAFTAFYSIGKLTMEHHAFTLVFPRWDVIAILLSVFLLTYTYIEARANYYRGSILCLSYLVLLGGFAFAPSRDRV